MCYNYVLEVCCIGLRPSIPLAAIRKCFHYKMLQVTLTVFVRTTLHTLPLDSINLFRPETKSQLFHRNLSCLVTTELVSHGLEAAYAQITSPGMEE